MDKDWTEDEEWQRFVDHTRKETVRAMADSAFVMTLSPGDNEPDIKLAVEVGLSILLNKPIIVLAWPGRAVPPGLARIAHEVIELSADLDTEQGQQELGPRLDVAIARWTAP